MINQYSQQQLDQAYKIAKERYSQRDNVTGVDMGFRYVQGKRTEQVVVRVHVEKKLSKECLNPGEVFPESLGGVPIDVIEGVYSPHQSLDTLTPRTTRQLQLQPGLSVGNPRVFTGTWGAIVYDNQTGRPCVLSNWHVLVGDDSALPGDPIVQPGLMDGGDLSSDRIGQLARSILDRRGDAAIAILDDRPDRPFSAAQYETEVVISSARMPKLGEILEKSGRTTGVTRARVDGFGTYSISYSVGNRDIEGFKLVSIIDGNPNDEEISAGGDSGSVWYDPNTREGVGLHFAGENDPQPIHENAIACHLPQVLAALNVSLTSPSIPTGNGNSNVISPTVWDNISPPIIDGNNSQFGDQGYGNYGSGGYSPGGQEALIIQPTPSGTIPPSLRQIVEGNLSVPFHDIATSPLTQSPSLCREIQQILKDINLYHFEVDGIFGKITRESLRDFKEQHNLGGGDTLGRTTARMLLNSLGNAGSSTLENHDFSTRQGTQRAIVRECRRQGLTLNSQIAYVLATTEHETANTFKPVKEAFFLGSRADAFRRRLRYFPYFGRGYVQLTHRINYQKYSRILGIDLVGNPDRALEAKNALFILVHGCRTGFFTGKPLGRYVNASQTDFINARRVINGLDRAAHISSLARNWQARIGSLEAIASESVSSLDSYPFLDENAYLSEEQRAYFETVMGD
jgi:predicted chitinase